MMKLIFLNMLFIASSAFALDFSVKGKPGGGSYGQVRSGQSSSGKTKTIDSHTTQACESDNDLPLEFLQTVMLNFNDFQIRSKNVDRHNGQAVFELSVPPYINACLKLNFSFEQDGNNIYIKTVNEYISAEVDTIKSSKHSHEKYKDCLEKSALFSEDSTGEKSINYDEVAIKGLISKPTKVSFTTKFDPSKNVNVFFKSPKTSSFGGQIRPVYGDFESTDLSCHYVENLGDEPVVGYRSLENEYAEKTATLCNNASLEKFEEIDEMLSRLIKMQDTLGNAASLISVLTPIRDELLDEKKESIFEKMAKIEEKLEGEENLQSKSKVMKNINKYLGLLEDYDELVIKPSEREIKELLKEREGASEERQEAIDERIAEINASVEALSLREAGVSVVYDALGRFNLVSQARKLEKVYRRSMYLGRVYSDDDSNRNRKPSMTFEEVDEKIAKHIDKLNNYVAPKWKEVASIREAKPGSTPSGIRASQSRLQRIEKNAALSNQHLAKQLEEGNKKNCQGWIVDQRKCQQWQQRAGMLTNAHQKRLARYGAQMQTETQVYNNYTQYLAQIRANQPEIGDDLIYNGNFDYDSGDLYSAYPGMSLQSSNGQMSNGGIAPMTAVSPMSQLAMNPYNIGQQGQPMFAGGMTGGMGSNMQYQQQQGMNGMGANRGPGGFSPVIGGGGMGMPQQQQFSGPFMGGANPYSGQQSMYPGSAMYQYQQPGMQQQPFGF